MNYCVNVREEFPDCSIEHLKANMDLNDWELSADQMQEIDDIGVEAKVVDNVYR